MQFMADEGALIASKAEIQVFFHFSKYGVVFHVEFFSPNHSLNIGNIFPFFTHYALCHVSLLKFVHIIQLHDNFQVSNDCEKY